ncbi:MAG: FapA family protein [Candidatus Goldbacteria bacterium]|nr:FapA family protein [Candidatus Goldiibacteriota bacterium]
MVDIDGYITINTEEDGTYLTVFPPKGKGKKVDRESVINEIKKLGLKDVEMDTVERAIKEATGQPVLIVKEKIAIKDGQIFINITPDEMFAQLTIVPPQGGGKDILEEDVYTALKEHNVVFGIKKDVISKLVKRGLDAKNDPTILLEPIEDIVAEGQNVQNGEDAKLEMLFDTTSAQAEETTETSSASPEQINETADKIDYRNVKSIQNVKKGTPLAKKVPPTNGVNGMTVTGKVIKAKPGNDVKFIIGKGVEPSPDNPELYIAAIDGQVIFKNNKLEVLSIYEINGDVDMSIGNIDFIGSVIVHGSVGEFRIKAGEDVIIDGVADGTEIISGGKVIVKGGIVGKKARVIAQDDVTTKYIRNAYVETEKSIIVNEAAMHSTLISGQKIIVMGTKGLIVGGTIAAAFEVSAKEIGSKLATYTEISIGETPKMREEMQKATTELKNIEEQLDKTKKGIIFLKDLSTKMGGNLPPDKRDLMAKLTRTQFKLMTEQKKWEEIKNKLEAKAKEMQTTKRGKVNCLGTVYTGVKIIINKVQRTISDELKYVTFVEKNGEIQVVPYSG